MLYFLRCLKHNTVSPYASKISEIQKSTCSYGSITSTDVTNDTRTDYQNKIF